VSAEAHSPRRGLERGPTRVLVVDDSAMVRKTLERHLSNLPDIQVVGTAPDPFVARELIAKERPDVMLLDVEMPRMDGLTFLATIMEHRPMPVIIISSIAHASGHVAMRALELGAVDVICKPSSALSASELGERVVEAVRAAARTRPRGAHASGEGASCPQRPVRRVGARAQRKIIAIGASTGGTEATNVVLSSFSPEDPGILIVQHIGAHFVEAYAERLNGNHAIEVKVAADGDLVRPGLALVAPGGLHMVLKRQGSEYRVQVVDGPKVHHQRPAVDVTFKSVAKVAGADAVGILLTGMGKDGAEGLLAMRQAGARTLAQDEESCVVYGMPRIAFEMGAVEEVCGLDSIGSQALRACAA
jgi:two-component system chemotaxis response regulator CheB